VPRYELDRTVTPSPSNELGVKGVGEAGTIAASAAVINAVVDALSPLGIRHVEMPTKPDRVWSLPGRARQGRCGQTVTCCWARNSAGST
jgi:carbon-monoxide dehydrogenase large subunit